MHYSLYTAGFITAAGRAVMPLSSPEWQKHSNKQWKGNSALLCATAKVNTVQQ
jgi:hypothetical protein